MQKGEWLPFSLLFSFCILHFHSWGQAPSPLGRGWGEGERSSRRFRGLRISACYGLTRFGRFNLKTALGINRKKHKDRKEWNW